MVGSLLKFCRPFVTDNQLFQITKVFPVFPSCCSYELFAYRRQMSGGHVEKRQRSRDWNEEEMQKLIHEYRKHREHLIRYYNGGTGNHEKRKLCWEAIRKAVDSVNPGVKRTIKQVREKWHNLQANARKKLKMHRNARLVENTLLSFSR